jgi:hypothetical protein
MTAPARPHVVGSVAELEASSGPIGEALHAGIDGERDGRALPERVRATPY